MAWRVAKSLLTLRDQVDDAWPNRNRASDGTIGDTDHQSRVSDHNPHCSAPSDPTVTAIDLTHDPKAGLDAGAITEALRESKDGRIKYVIYNYRIFSSYTSSTGRQAWQWGPYSGPNAHTLHFHLSVHCQANKDSTKPWAIGKVTFKPRYEVGHRGGKTRTYRKHHRAIKRLNALAIKHQAEGRYKWKRVGNDWSKKLGRPKAVEAIAQRSSPDREKLTKGMAWWLLCPDDTVLVLRVKK